MSYYNDDQNKIRRRKVSANVEHNQISKPNNLESRSKINNIDRERMSVDRSKTVNESVKRSVNRKKSKVERRNKSAIALGKKFLVLILVVLVLTSAVGSVFVLTSLKGSQRVDMVLLESKYISSEVVSNDQIPKYLKDAVVSIEDERFYKHNGVDEISLLRSVVHNVLSDSTQGGSTIEMQISKNLLTDDDRTIKRKIKDIYNATSMDKNMTKDDILGVYLNNIYLGKSSYGVGKGAKVYFGKKVSELSLAQCAMLAGITNNPARYSEHREAKRRQETILYKMNELGYINDVEYKNALSEEVPFKSEIK
ncbi:transglycosylase domain-containing protein [Romboutsia lituseburensis]|uniref:transglycosylase domain-containing protein n=1 Tax=Romboutsia lituseburensis TaxID=1537 RepID=UPI00215A6818|nr:transglycosylase domain-containing protein [Romboutsia lituseburensis]MCR8746627.1 transglycosylase domain-containing protein [Romboutsia lituseburensis]